MDIKTTTTELLKVPVLRPNEGQIPDVPANPRYITEQEFEALKASIQQDNLTGVLQMKVYNHEGEWIVLDGNMRLKALQELGLDEVQCLIVPQGTDAKTLRKIVISANSTFGNWDMDMIANEWDADEAREWGIDVPNLGLPSELEGLDLTPEDMAELEGDGKTDMERIIIVYPAERADDVAALVGLSGIDKVVYNITELMDE